MDKLITALFGFISAYLVFRQNDKGNELKYIINERQKWRDTIRDLSASFMGGTYNKNGNHKSLTNPELKLIREKIAVRLNPDDNEDKYILCLMDCYIKTTDEKCKEDIRKELRITFASILKHDWERVKNETKMERNLTSFILFLCSILTTLYAFSSFDFIPKKINFFTFKSFYEKNQNYSDLLFIELIVFVLSVFTIYQILKYLRWRRKYRIENNLCWLDLKKTKYEYKCSQCKNCNCQKIELENSDCTIFKCICKNENLNNLSCQRFFKSIFYYLNENNKAWNKYLGYSIRSRVSEKK
jgi:hypothetical protein